MNLSKALKGMATEPRGSFFFFFFFKEKSIQVRENSKCKGPEARVFLCEQPRELGERPERCES